MKVSLIVAVYKDVEALGLIIEALKTQTYKNFEVIVAEDGKSNEMKTYIKNIKGIEVKHTIQEDLGIRKTRSLNNGILATSGEYLVFIDGDCVPFSTFIEGHILLAEKGFVISGRRVNLGIKYSTMLRRNEITPYQLEKSFCYRYFAIAKDSTEGHTENGFYIHPDSVIYKYFLKNRNSNTNLLGCNYSCYRQDMININGYDESYGETAVGDDTDLQWRFKAIGIKFKSAKFIANVFHLYHSRSFRTIDPTEALNLMEHNQENNLFVANKGLTEH